MKKLTLFDLCADDCINVLQPVKCDCGCGGYADVILKDNDEVLSFCGSILEDVDCNNAWCFAITDEGVIFANRDEDGIYCYSTGKKDGSNASLHDKVKLIRDIVKEFEPHCIGVIQLNMISKHGNAYRVVMEDLYDVYDEEYEYDDIFENECFAKFIS